MPPSQPKKPEATRNERNEYIPSFIAKKPFYVDDSAESGDADYLEHQRLQQTAAASLADSKWYDRGRKAAPAATKYRKGACANCGAMTHKTKECLSRPRKQGAKWTGKDIQADELIQDVNMGWDAKRDRWNGYDAKEHELMVKNYNDAKELDNDSKGLDADEDEEEEGAKYEEETDMGRQQSTSTRNLRLREDTAKYLLNLDLDSAKYDPKTRSMVDSGGLGDGDKGAELVAEEGFMRASGDAAEFERAQKYAWETQERGEKNKIHFQANPTAGQFQLKKEQDETAKRREAQRKALKDKYGGQEQFQSSALKDTAILENERYVEYDERGRIKGEPEKPAKSKYAEDVLINNHTSVWGSWWKEFKWGYSCCHSTVKNSYCTGEAGKQAFEETERLRMAIEDGTAQNEAVEEDDNQAETSIRAQEEKAIRDERAKKRAFGDMMAEADEEEMEEWRKKRVAADDPMAKLLGKDELLS